MRCLPDCLVEGATPAAAARDAGRSVQGALDAAAAEAQAVAVPIDAVIDNGSQQVVIVDKGEGRFEHVTWDTALELIVERMQQAKAAHGGASILPYSYGGSNGLLTQDNLDARLWRCFGASRLARTVSWWWLGVPRRRRSCRLG